MAINLASVALFLRRAWISVRYGRPTEHITGTAGHGVPSEIEYRGRDGKAIGFWAYGHWQPGLPYQGELETKRSPVERVGGEAAARVRLPMRTVMDRRTGAHTPALLLCDGLPAGPANVSIEQRRQEAALPPTLSTGEDTQSLPAAQRPRA